MALLSAILLLQLTPASTAQEEIAPPDELEREFVDALLEDAGRGLSLKLEAWRSAEGEERALLGDEAAALAQERRSYIGRAMRLNANHLMELLLSDQERTEVETLAPGFSETPAGLTGFLEVTIVDFENEDGELTQELPIYVLETVTGERVRLFPARGGGRPDLSGKDVQVTGYRLDDDLIYDASDPGTMVDLTPPPEEESRGGGRGGGGCKKNCDAEEAAVNPDHVGPQRVVAILVNFSDTTFPNVTPQQISNVLFVDVDSYYQETSYGKVSLEGDVHGVYPLTLAATCNYIAVENAAVAAADADIDFTQFDRLMIFAPFTGCTFGGLGTIGKKNVSTADGTVRMSVSWISARSATSKYLLGHELGHNFGAHHASFWNCGSDPIDSSTCTRVEYGHRYSIMGAGNTGHWAAAHKDLITGWLDPENVADVPSSGTYTIEPIENASSGVQALKIPRQNPGDYLYLEYRQPIGEDRGFINANVYDGPILSIIPGALRVALIDPTVDITNPGSSLSSALEPGQSFIDPATGTAVTTVSADNQSVTVDVVLGSCLDFIPPTVTIDSPAPGDRVFGTVPIAATVTDNESPIDRVEFYLRDFTVPGFERLLGTATEPPYTLDWDTTTVSNGFNAIQVRAYDRPGDDCPQNEGRSEYRTVFVANGLEQNPPTVTMAAPGDNDNVSMPFLVRADAFDDTGISYVEFWADPYGHSPCEVSADHNGPHPPMCRFRPYFPPFSRWFPGWYRQAFVIGFDLYPPYQVPINFAPFGRYKIWARAVDHARNEGISEMIDVTVHGPRARIIIIILSPSQQDDLVPGSTVTITTDSGEDLIETGSVDFIIDGELVHRDTTIPFAYEWTVPDTPGQVTRRPTTGALLMSSQERRAWARLAC
jgi:M6 family metalloprotease-like protein